MNNIRPAECTLFLDQSGVEVLLYPNHKASHVVSAEPVTQESAKSYPTEFCVPDDLEDWLVSSFCPWLPQIVVKIPGIDPAAPTDIIPIAERILKARGINISFFQSAKYPGIYWKDNIDVYANSKANHHPHLPESN